MSMLATLIEDNFYPVLISTYILNLLLFVFFSEPRVSVTADGNQKGIRGRLPQVIWDLVQSILMGK